MTGLADAVEQILNAQKRTKKPLAIILAGHNGSGKSTMWRKSLSGQLQIPLLNADRMMLSILPEAFPELLPLQETSELSVPLQSCLYLCGNS